MEVAVAFAAVSQGSEGAVGVVAVLAPVEGLLLLVDFVVQEAALLALDFASGVELVAGLAAGR